MKAKQFVVALILFVAVLGITVACTSSKPCPAYRSVTSVEMVTPSDSLPA